MTKTTNKASNKMQGLKEYMTMLYDNVDTVRAFNRLCYK